MLEASRCSAEWQVVILVCLTELQTAGEILVNKHEVSVKVRSQVPRITEGTNFVRI